MLRLASDVDVNGRIIRGLRRRCPEIDLLRAQDAFSNHGDRVPDPDILAWAASLNRVLISNDGSTLADFAWARVTAGAPMPGVIVTTNDQSIGSAIEDILIIAECYSAEEMNGRVERLPLR
jgi:hypothetical protein